MFSTKICSLVLFSLSLIGVYIGWGIQTEFSYEPLGPRPFPVATLALLALCSLLLFFFQEKSNIKWYAFDVWKKLIALIIAFCIFAFLFEYLGFVLSSIFFIFCVSLLFQAKLFPAFIFAVCCSISIYYLFDSILQITLPIGLIFT